MNAVVLVVEKDPIICESILARLKMAGNLVFAARTAEEALFVTSVQHVDVLVLDLELPFHSRMGLLGALRQFGKDFHILILSSRADVETRIDALSRGADDFLIKPFSLAELEVRIQVLLRRNKSRTSMQLTVHDLVLDVLSHQVKCDGHIVEITRIEFDLLSLLMRRAHQVVSREVVAREVWKDVNRATSIDNLIDVHIGRLRRKIDTPGRKPMIHTVRSLGFLLSEKELPMKTVDSLNQLSRGGRANPKVKHMRANEEQTKIEDATSLLQRFFKHPCVDRSGSGNSDSLDKWKIGA